MLHEMRDGFPLGGGRHHFFPSRSFSATLSSIASASIRFSFAFFVFQRSKASGLRHVHPAELRLPFVNACVAHTVLAAQIGDRHRGLLFLQDRDDLLFEKRLRFMSWSSIWARTNFKLD
jgi:hypothetical protein